MSGTPVLTAKRVTEIYLACKATSDTTEAVLTNGIKTEVKFCYAALGEHQDEILALLAELPAGFKVPPAGESFLEAVRDRHGRLWTDLHETVEQLLLLGLAHGHVFISPREHWEILPGGMPYVGVASTEATPELWHAMIWRATGGTKKFASAS